MCPSLYAQLVRERYLRELKVTATASLTVAAATTVLVAALGLLYLAGAVPALVITALLVWGLVGCGWAVAHHGPPAAALTGVIICAIAVPAAIATNWLTPPHPSAPCSADAMAMATATEAGCR